MQSLFSEFYVEIDVLKIRLYIKKCSSSFPFSNKKKFVTIEATILEILSIKVDHLLGDPHFSSQWSTSFLMRFLEKCTSKFGIYIIFFRKIEALWTFLCGLWNSKKFLCPGKWKLWKFFLSKISVKFFLYFQFHIEIDWLKIVLYTEKYSSLTFSNTKKFVTIEVTVLEILSIKVDHLLADPHFFILMVVFNGIIGNCSLPIPNLKLSNRTKVISDCSIREIPIAAPDFCSLLEKETM